ncbi:hypothetical protein SDC9_48565 [bioreactor metagenome]|uniref:Uncharacterized protein n=1 Tax=bioreactor metagenome TaxID=1076179 RepID=A0A644WER3_9ZZZZ
MTAEFNRREIDRKGKAASEYGVVIPLADMNLPLGHQILIDDDNGNGKGFQFQVGSENGCNLGKESGRVQESTLQRQGGIEEALNRNTGDALQNLIRGESGRIHQTDNASH